MFGRGGWRKGAGRKPGPRPGVQHRRRPIHRAVNPVNLTLRARAGLPSLRSSRLYQVVSDCIEASSSQGFRVVLFSVQGDHVHMLVEADDHSRLGSGVRGLTIRIARAVNRVLGRSGRFWGDRRPSSPPIAAQPPRSLLGLRGPAQPLRSRRGRLALLERGLPSP
jgi:putative transposase